MTRDPLLIDVADGYTESKTIPAQPGVSPELRVVFRPALAAEWKAIGAKANNPDPQVLDKYETDLLVRHLVSVNGREYRRPEEAARLRPWVRKQCLDLILGYALSDEALDLGNSATG